MTVCPAMRDSLLKSVPHMRAFAISLTGNIDRADDLVQEALAKGLGHLDSFQPGTNMRAWLLTILRNEFNTVHRKRRREVEDPDEEMASRLASAPAQLAHLEIEDLKTALARLPVEQREALLLVTAEGCSYEEAACICNTNIGTIKSRVNRARLRLSELLNVDGAEDIGPDRFTRAVLTNRPAFA